MKARNYNRLRHGALFSLFVTSYIPLFLIVIMKQVRENWEFLHWSGMSKAGICCFCTKFGMSCLLGLFTIAGVIGIVVLFHNMKSNLHNGSVVTVMKINNRNSEAVGYIATYIVPFLASDFSSLSECSIFVIIMGLIYTIYSNSNMVLINPLLTIWYSLLEVEYKIVGDKGNEVHDALIITDTKDFKEKVTYNIYQICFKLFYGKERK